MITPLGLLLFSCITFEERLDLAADGVRHAVVRDALHVLQLVVVGHHGVAAVGNEVHHFVSPCRFGDTQGRMGRTRNT